MVMQEFAKLDGFDCEFVLVNDASPDSTFAEIRKLSDQYPNVRGIDLMRNFGQHNALMCALNHARGDFILGMDDDMQTHPSQLSILVNEIAKGEYDVVYGVYRKRLNSPLKNFTSWINKVTSSILLNRPRSIESSNFWVITRAVRDEVIRYRNYNPYVDALFYRATHNIGNVEIQHHERAYGSSNYNFRKLMKLWLAYLNYSVVPLRMVFWLGCLTSAAGLVAGLVTAIRKLIDPSITVGWSSVVCIMLVFFGLVMLSLGILGEYLGKLMLSVNDEPQYIVREKLNFSPDDPEGRDAGSGKTAGVKKE